MDPRTRVEAEDNDVSVAKLTSQACIGVVIFVENFLILVVVIRSPELHTFKYIFTASLAVVDGFIGILTFSVIPLGLSIIIQRKGRESFLTTLFVTFCMSTHLLSLVQMAAIAIERYLYVARPFFYQRRMTSKVIRCMLVAVWTFFVAYNALLMVLQIYVVGEYVTVIREVNTYVLKVGGLATYVFITVVTCTCYSLILCQVKRTREVVSSLEFGRKVPKWKEHVKSLKFFVVMFGFYFFMTSPCIVEECLPEFFSDSISDGVRSFLIFSLLLNSGVNFIILNVADSVFRQTLRTKVVFALKRCCCREGYDMRYKNNVNKIHILSHSQKEVNGVLP